VTTYHVVWEIDIEGDDPREAAIKAREAQQHPRPGYWVGVFDVTDENGNTVRVDLDEEPVSDGA
jgi:hypothetical protein